jgi:hypothetical protein
VKTFTTVRESKNVGEKPLNMEAISSPESLVTAYITTVRHNPQNHYLRDGKSFFTAFLPSVVVECLTLLLSIREVPGSNLWPETGDLE